MKKRVLAAMLAGVMVLGLAGCGGSSDDKKEDAKTEDTAETDSTDAAKEEELKTIGEKPEEDKEGVLSVKLKNLTGKVITGVTVKNEKDESGRNSCSNTTGYVRRKFKESI